MRIRYKILIGVGIFVIVIFLVIYNINKNIEKERVWSEINSEYFQIVINGEFCINSCSYYDFDKLFECFDGCEIKLNKSLEEVGIKHQAWRDKYVK